MWVLGLHFGNGFRFILYRPAGPRDAVRATGEARASAAHRDRRVTARGGRLFTGRCAGRPGRWRCHRVVTWSGAADAAAAPRADNAAAHRERVRRADLDLARREDALRRATEHPNWAR